MPWPPVELTGFHLIHRKGRRHGGGVLVAIAEFFPERGVRLVLEFEALRIDGSLSSLRAAQGDLESVGDKHRVGVRGFGQVESGLPARVPELAVVGEDQQDGRPILRRFGVRESERSQAEGDEFDEFHGIPR